MDKKIVAVFDRREEAERARADLLNAGFAPGDLTLVDQTTGAAVEEAGHESFWDHIRNFFTGEEEDYYQEASRRGGTLLTVNAPENKIDRAVDILNSHHPVDLEQRAAEWRQAGWTGQAQATATPPPQPKSTAKGARKREEETIPVVEEQLRVGKRVETRGGVRVYTHVTEQPVREDVQLREETVNVERRKTDRPAREGELREQTVEMRETREEPVVSKEARVVEEVVLNKDVSERTESVEDTVRRTDVEVEQLDKEFRSDYERRFAGKGQTYEQVQPIYQQSVDIVRDPRYRDLDWSEAEPDLRRDFEARHPGRWDEFKDSIHRAYDRVHQRKAA